MKNLKELTETELDALKELLFVSVANAATIISKVIGREVKITSSKVEIVDISGIPNKIGPPNEVVIGVYSKILGEKFAGLLLVMPIKSAEEMYRLIVKNYQQIGDEVFSVVGKSALIEVGNIIFASIVNVLSSYTEKNLFISVPKFAIDISAAIVDVILSEIALESDYAVMIEILMSDVERQISFKMFIIPDLEATKDLLKALERFVSNK